MKPVTQREARQLRRDLAETEFECKEKARRLAEEIARVDELRAERDNARKRVEQLAAELEAERAYTRLASKQKIAEWANVPDTVAEAVRVAAHLGRVVIFTLKAPEARWNSNANVFGGAMVAASEMTPERGGTLAIYAAERVK